MLLAVKLRVGQMREQAEIKMKAYYYGCYQDIGHYFWERTTYGLVKAERGNVRLAWSRHSGKPPEGFQQVIPWGYSVDGALQPKDTLENGQALLHHKDGWTALAFWDNSVDRRPKSSSTFLFDDILTFDQALEAAHLEFPQIFQRFNFEVKQYG